MRFKKPLYYCNMCRVLLEGSEELLFVEDESTKGFCSESCIEKFYIPVIEHYEGLEKKLRKDLGIADEPCLKNVEVNKYLESVIRKPKKVTVLENELGESIYSLQSVFRDDEDQDFTYIVLCLFYQNQPSFVLLVTASSNERMVSELTFEKEVEWKGDQGNSDDGLELDAQTMETLERKKSSYLANLLESRSEADIPFEKFVLYDQYLEKTLEDPDEIYQFEDDDKEMIYTYIKAHDEKGVSFYYFVVCLNVSSSWKDNVETLVPIISFPSVDGDVYRHYKKGELISGNLKS